MNGNRDIDLVAPKKQGIWRWPAVINFFLGGTGAGFYILSSLFVFIDGGTDVFSRQVSQDSGALLVCFGLFALFFEAGRPMRAIYLLKRIRSSWMSFEILAGILFLLFATANRLFPSTIFFFCAFFAAVGFILSQGFIIYRSSGIIAWNVPLVPLLFSTTALASGGGLFLILSAAQQIRAGAMGLLIIQACLVMDVTAWAIYLIWSRDSSFLRATDFLRRPFSLFFISIIGHFLPFVMITGLLAARQTGSSGLEFVVTGVIGVSMTLGALSGKINLILGANFARGIILSASKDHAPTLKEEIRFQIGQKDCADSGR